MMTWALLLPLLLACPQGQAECDSGAPAEPADSGAYTLCPHEDGADCDGDGYTVPEDCYDHDADIHPFAADSGRRSSLDPGEDSDCNGVDGPFALTVAWGWHVQDVPDMDRDGIRDYVAAEYQPEGDSRFAMLWLSSDIYDPAATVSDLTAVTLDMIDYEDQVNVHGYFSAGSSLGDFDADGDGDFGVLCDLLNTGSNTDICLFDGDPSRDADFGRAPWRVVPHMPPQTEGIRTDVFRVLGDLDQDGVDEVVIGSAPAYIYSVADLATEGFGLSPGERAIELEYPNTWDSSEGRLDFGIRQADMDGDGLDELFTGTRVYEGTDLAQAGFYGASDARQVGDLGANAADCSVKPAGDVSGDGRTDLLFNCEAHGDFGEVIVATYESSGGAPAVTFATIAGTEQYAVGPISGAVGDADDDGFDDVGVGGPRPENYLPDWSTGLTIVRGDSLVGTINLDGTMRVVAASTISDINTLDFDGDGLLDLLVYDEVIGLLAHTDILP